MVHRPFPDLESLETIAQDADTRDVCLRMAALARAGRLKPFLRELDDDGELDVGTKSMLTELAGQPGFLHALEDYVHHTTIAH